ncbi:hypothetical protein [Devosia sp.]|uniref:hypothetical protein n=1 Tax=Devosia sp. TaxID=1871048 RepID=UPI0035AECAA6
MVLVDDDSHSARLMIRVLLAHGAPSVSWMDTGPVGAERIGALLEDARAALPGLVIVDLKASSSATHEFIERLRGMRNGSALLIAAMAPSLEKDVRDRLLACGADAVFERHAEVDFYRREAAAIVSFWVRNQHLEAVGT